MLIMLGGTLTAPLLSSPTQAQTATKARLETSQTASNDLSVRGCPRPSDAKEAKVLTFDEGKLEARLAVNLGSGEFKVVTIKLWNHRDDPRPIIPVIEAARITQGKLHFYTPNLNGDPESVHDKFIIMTEMGGPQVCWATPSSLFDEGAYPVAEEAKPEGAPAAANPVPRVKARPKDQTSHLPAGITTAQR